MKRFAHLRVRVEILHFVVFVAPQRAPHAGDVRKTLARLVHDVVVQARAESKWAATDHRLTRPTEVLAAEVASEIHDTAACERQREPLSHVARTVVPK